MGNTAIIEVAIGLIFLFSLLSILVTQINTIIVNVLNLRTKRLKGQLDIMLSDPVIRARFMTHPLIRMVEVDNKTSGFLLKNANVRLTEDVAIRLTEGKQSRIKYIATETFVDVLIDVLTEETSQRLYKALADLIYNMEPSVEKSRFREILRHIQLTGYGMTELRSMTETVVDLETKHKMLTALNLVDAALDKLQAENSDLIPLLLGVRQIRDKYLETSLQAILAAPATSPKHEPKSRSGLMAA